VNSGGILGGVAGGVLTGFAAKGMDPHDLLLISAVLLAGLLRSPPPPVGVFHAVMHAGLGV
jgi:hypothetical protein